MQLTEKDEQRFWNKVALPNEQGCMEWTAGLKSNGYGQFGVGRRATARKLYPHRVSYELLVGPIPKELEVDHLCKNRRCVQPDHLELVTHAENLRRSRSISTVNAEKTHCPQGHEYNEENTHIRKNGNRQCRVCGREQARARRASKEK